MSVLKKIRILIADDHNLFRFGLASIIQSTPNLEVCAEAKDGNECLQKYHEFHPDVIISDISMPDLDGIEMTKQLLLLNKNAIVIILTMHLTSDYLEKAIQAGAYGYLHKNCSATELISAIETALKREFVLGSTISDIIRERFVNKLPKDSTTPSLTKHSHIPELSELTHRELEILILVGKGLTSGEIGKQLFISPRTADTHRFKLMQKLNLKSKSDVVRLVLEHNL